MSSRRRQDCMVTALQPFVTTSKTLESLRSDTIDVVKGFLCPWLLIYFCLYLGDANPIHTIGDYSKPSHEGYKNTIELPEGNNVVPLRYDTIQLVQNGCSFHELWFEDLNQHLKDFLKLVDSLDLNGDNRERTRLLRIFYDHVNLVTRRTINQSAGGKLRDINAKESWALLEDISLYDDESWNDPRDFAKPVKAISLPQDVPSASDRHLIELENQVQRLMKAYLAPMQPTQVNKITSSCEIFNGPHDTHHCMENPEQDYVEYASSRTDEARGLVSNFMASQDARLSKFEVDFKQHKSEMTNKINIVLKAITDRIAGALPSDTVKNLKLNVNSTTSVLSARSYPMEDPQCSSQIHNLINANDDSHKKGPEDEGSAMTEGLEVEYYIFLTRSELPYHRKLDPREDTNREVSNFMGRIKGMHVFVGNFTYVIDFMIFEDISSIIDPRLSQVVLGKPFVEISNMTRDPPEGVVRFINGTDEIAYKMPHKIEQYNSLLDLEKEHTKMLYLRNEKDKRKGVEYSYSSLIRLKWLVETLQKGSPVRPYSEPYEPLRPYQHWKKAHYEEALRKSDQVHQNFEKCSIEMTHKLDDMIELSKSLPMKISKEDSECGIDRIKIPSCMLGIDFTKTYDRLIGDRI
uniref:MAK10-like protein n=1 Tax=Tanacetum cinerariifolium TaxID=118510 RepID=A0A6L2JIF9_TANCI|nr:MAK10-like protein [Tanacetum cinerariifolium]